jgi:hypothetical protein
MKKLFTKILLFFLDRDLILKNLDLASKNEIRGQHLFNGQLLENNKELENFLKEKIANLNKVLKSINFIYDNSELLDKSIFIFYFLDEQGNRKVKVFDTKKFNENDFVQLTALLKKYSSVEINEN